MKNKTFFGVLTGLVAVGGVFAVLQFTPESASANLSKEEAEEKVSSQFPGEIVEFELDKDGNRNVYEIEIEGDKYVYDLEIDAESGEILELEEKVNKEETSKKAKNEASKQTDKQAEHKLNTETKEDNNEEGKKDRTPQTQKSDTIITLQEAKNIALAEYDGRIEEVELDEDDGMKYYEIEMETEKEEIEIEIDAYTGNIISISKDELDD